MAKDWDKGQPGLLNRWVDAYLRWLSLRARRWLGLWLVLVLGSLYPVSQLALRTDFTELLPATHPAAVAIREVLPRQLSSTNLVVILESPDRDANRRFAESLRPKLGALVGTLFSEVTYRPDTEVADAAALYKWHYAELAELRQAEQLLDRLIASRQHPLLVDLEGDPESELRTLRDGITRRLPPRDDSPYFEFHPSAKSDDYPDPSVYHLGIMLWRRGSGLASADDGQMLQAVERLIAQAQPTRFHPQLRVEYSGAVAMALAEQRGVQSDLTAATSVTLVLVLLVMYLHFRRLRDVVLSCIPALLGVLLSLLVARYGLLYLNANTAFLIAIILGNGINTPIVLLSRYNESLRDGQLVPQALRMALTSTVGSTLSAALAASIAYGTLLGTDLRGLSQFGLVGGVGMVLCWLLTFALLPPLLILGRERDARPGRLNRRSLLGTGLFGLGSWLLRKPGWALLLIALSIGGVLMPALRFAREPLEYDFSKLRTQDKNVERRWRLMYDLGMGNLGAGYIGRDGVMLVERPEQADAVAQALREQDARLGDRHVLQSVRTLSSVLPQDQAQKLAILRRVSDRIARYRSLISEEEWADLQDVLPPNDLRVLTVHDLPRRIREAFTEVDGQTGRLIGIDADPSRFHESDGRDLIRLSRSLAVTVGGTHYVAASPSTLFAAMLEVIMRDGPKITLRCLALVILLAVATFGLRGSWPVLLSLGVGLLWLLGAVAYFDLKVNFLNFVALPITMGIGVEYATNLWARCLFALRQPEGLTLPAILRETGAAVSLCSLTTVIGYGSLLLSQNRALQSFGKVACLGEVTCLLAALLVIPAVAKLQAQPARWRSGR